MVIKWGLSFQNNLVSKDISRKWIRKQYKHMIRSTLYRLNIQKQKNPMVIK